jgi:hypothetical protein
MKKAVILYFALAIFLGGAVMASTKNDNRIKIAEQAFKEKRYVDAKTIFAELQEKSEYRSKSLLYLAMINYETGQIENAIVGLDDFKRKANKSADAALLGAAENLAIEVDNNFGMLDLAVFDGNGSRTIDPGYYSLNFSSQGGLNPAQEARIKIINKILAQTQGILSWKSDGTFLNGKIRYFPIKLYDTAPFSAEVNGVPLSFRFDFQTLQGLWIPNDILHREAQTISTPMIPENTEQPFYHVQQSKKNDYKILIIGGAAAAILITAAALSF